MKLYYAPHTCSLSPLIVLQELGLPHQLQQCTFLQGERFTVADAYLYTVLGWFKFFAIELSRWPAIAAYEERIAARPSVQAAMQAHV